MNRRGQAPAENGRRWNEGVRKPKRSRKKSRLAPKNRVLERRKMMQNISMEKVNSAITLSSASEISKDFTHACRALRGRNKELASVTPECNEKDVPNLRSQPATPGTLPLDKAGLGPDKGIVEDNSGRDLRAYFNTKITELVY
jgi:DNA polymerase II large subunit